MEIDITCPKYSLICVDLECPNSCSGLGTCINGKCECIAGYGGLDCSQTTQPGNWAAQIDAMEKQSLPINQTNAVLLPPLINPWILTTTEYATPQLDAIIGEAWESLTVEAMSNEGTQFIVTFNDDPTVPKLKV